MAIPSKVQGNPVKDYNNLATQIEQELKTLPLADLINKIRTLDSHFTPAYNSLSKNEKANLSKTNVSLFTIQDHLKKIQAELKNLTLSNSSSAPGVSTTTMTSKTPAPAPITTAVKAETVIRVRGRIPFGHTLEIKGQGEKIDWSRGSPLTATSDGALEFRTQGRVEFKLVLDGTFELQDRPNRVVEAGQTLEIEKPELKMPVVPVIVNYKGDGKLFIRGSGGNLSWDKGIELKQANGKYFFEMENAADLQYKLLLNDVEWEKTDQDKDRQVKVGQPSEITPIFASQPQPAPQPTPAKVTPPTNVTPPTIGAGLDRTAYNLTSDSSTVIVKNRVDDTNIEF